MSAPPWGVYVHVPWCRHRCPYCAFDIVAREAPAPDAWVAGVERDLDRWGAQFVGRPVSLYFGGGTPSVLPPDALARVVARVDADDVTAEANPEDVSGEWLRSIEAAGVRRISLGVQSLQPSTARQLGRGHHDARPALEALAASGLQSWSADLIFGLPGQTVDALASDLDTLLSFRPPHVSIYGLTIEDGTPFAQLERRGQLAPLDDEVWRAMYDHIVATLQAAGLDRYEVSNFAHPGHRSRHNRLYWEGGHYLGAGPSAHGFAPDGTRWVNPSWPAWQRGAPANVERPTPREAAIDRLISGLRGVDGVPTEALGPHRIQPAVLTRLQRAGLLRPTGEQLALSDAGYPVADAVIRALVDGLEAPPSPVPVRVPPEPPG